ncbi:TonB-dependent receptor [Bradyrhizobium sp. U87765 SZCCT0131]|uniref:TonB-dependent receptor n=1 Tax=unclassified Bradyrhizobium TaxID=2631580 RepID=UPI001BA4ABE9|nr:MULTISPECIES: TonB-dependent receptor [unclassified Bradyrhizobium]MBR1221935.1 TonB-dependent receptor [Bradyrhizobium sp. U87765 SZCCT0131]MBR1263867.1 TonB-dependent receptor [Bradyrhizobium sp. U87765 SZCCT0134]MBR1302563.1 TonB-dependent receptor [Bradyrhizobium sp. U87765 SZCCT0110]MBR1320117.1 TonB-dependent receptor [Bradyrhizobium sp. U87765 SZCCT0109]MBR1348770.1 TonB-dependent receptor [Bradyrhizobium sp. U87765 SZCCT0048]
MTVRGGRTTAAVSGFLIGAAMAVPPASAQTTVPQNEARQLAPVTVTAPTVVAKRRSADRRAAAQRQATAPRAVQPPRLVPAAVTTGGPGAAQGPRRNDLSTAVSALPAASTTLDAAWVSRSPIATYGDLFRSLPGVNISNFGQGALGYGIAMRGYTEAEHGRDIAYFIDGVPINQVSSLHTPNYADLNILIPEAIQRVDIIRGPFSVEYGDSSLGGSVNIVTKRSEPVASVTASGGSFGTGRGLITYSSQGKAVDPYIAWEGYHTDGSRDNSGVDRYNAFNTVTTRVGTDGQLSVNLQAYGSTFGAPGYISRDAVLAGTLSPRTAVNATDGGNRYYENLVANYSAGAPDQELSGVLYVNHSLSNRYADFGGGQRWQQDDRVTAGGTVRKVWTGAVGDVLPVQLLVGGSWRTDSIDAFQGSTVARALVNPTANLGIDQTSLAGFAQLQVKPLEWLKLTGGGRYDRFVYDLKDNLTPANSQTLSPGVLSPKAGVSITPLSWLELYANYGQGFRSIDAALEVIGNPGIKPFKIESKEVGAQLRFDRFSFQVDAWSTFSENESFQQAPGLPVSFLGHARRDGFDLDARLLLVKAPDRSLALFANYGEVTARLLDSAPSFYVPNVPDYVANVGVDFDVATWNAQRLFGSAYVTFVGRKKLTQDGQLTTSPYSRVTGRLAYGWPEGWTAFTQATWYPGDRTSEIAINLGDPVTASSADIVTSPQARLTLLAGLSYRLPVPAAMALPTTKMVVK